jgi:hypothetical protein
MRRASSEKCKPIGWFRDHSKLSCVGCGYEIAFHNEEFRAEINELRAVMSGLRCSRPAALEKRVPESKSARRSTKG